MEEKFESVKETILQYPDQLQQAWDEINALEIPDDYKDIDNVVVCGMGGSALGARMVDSLIYDSANHPVEIFNQYKLPEYANKNTLAIISSYSGTTEETVSCALDAIHKGTKVFIITTGGKLKEMKEQNNLPGYIFEPKYNPSKQPRMSIGYAVGAILALFSKLNIALINDEDVVTSITSMKNFSQKFSKDDDSNLAKQMAVELENMFPVLVASEHLFGSVYTIKNQFNESAKTFSDIFELSELNHHLMEGLKNPEKNKEVMRFVFFESDLYRDEIVKRYSLTKDVVDKNEIKLTTYKAVSEKRIEQVFEVLTFGSFVVYYLTKIYNIDPTAIPWVDYFKEQLKK